ncbi:Ubiquinone biosynthesis accessory factor UbiK [Gammaproteobacteria bacterium]
MNPSSSFGPAFFDDLAQRFAKQLPPGLTALQEDFQKNLRSTLQAAFSRMDLVTREEFDVQAAVLARTREKIEILEGQVARLEQRLGLVPPGPGVADTPDQSV